MGGIPPRLVAYERFGHASQNQAGYPKWSHYDPKLHGLACIRVESVPGMILYWPLRKGAGTANHGVATVLFVYCLLWVCVCVCAIKRVHIACRLSRCFGLVGKGFVSMSVNMAHGLTEKE